MVIGFTAVESLETQQVLRFSFDFLGDYSTPNPLLSPVITYNRDRQ